LQYQVKRAVPEAKVQEEGWFDANWFYELNGMEASTANWVKTCDSTEISSASADYLRSFYQDCLVVGFELPGLMIKLFQESGIPYLDFIVHPVRFMDDIFFGVRTNVRRAFEILRGYALDDDLIHVQANIHKATVGREPQRDVTGPAGLFVGQTEVDRSLLADGGILLEARDFAPRIRELFNRHPRMYYKPHPCAKDTTRIVENLARLIGRDIHITQANVYSLLAHPGIETVCGISSSVLYEAAYFGRQPEFLSSRRMRFDDGSETVFDPAAFVPVYDAFFSPGFWSEVLAPICPVKSCRDVRPAPKTNRLRNSLHCYWSYNFLDHEILSRSTSTAAPPPTVVVSPPDPQVLAAEAAELHREALAMFERGQTAAALTSLEQALSKHETGDRWNDWAAIQVGLKCLPKAEEGFRKALELEPENPNISVNLGTLLLMDGRQTDAWPLLMTGYRNSDVAQRQKLIESLRKSQAIPQHLGGSQEVTHLDEGVFGYLVGRFGIRSFLDIGCGPGGMVQVAARSGLSATGIDGDPLARLHFAPTGNELIVHDFAAAPIVVDRRYDLAWSVEFLEHVEERFQDNYLPAFQAAQYVFCTAAPPGKGGYHHVNCRDASYWQNVFAGHGFTLDRETTAYLRRISTMPREFVRETGMFFVRNQAGPCRN
jgi:SAM-dependent methyltransferase